MKNTSVKSGSILKALGLILSLSALPLVSSMTGCASSENKSVSHERSEDLAISSNVRAALADASRHNHFADVMVETTDEVVTLSGYVNSEEQKNSAGKIAKKVHDVERVVNNIIVRSGS